MLGCDVVKSTLSQFYSQINFHIIESRVVMYILVNQGHKNRKIENKYIFFGVADPFPQAE